MKLLSILFICLSVFLVSCGGGGGSTTANEEGGNDEGDGMNDSSDDDSDNSGGSGGETSFTKKVDVFGVAVYATDSISDEKILHTAKVLAEYLDNNNDGVVDNQLVIDAMKSKSAYMFMVVNESEVENLNLPSGSGQILLEAETRPEGSSSEGFDATLEEVLHLVTHAGYSEAYPTVFGESSSALTDAMDIARGGKFTTIPSSYPSGAWYTYDDTTCDYSCMATEYFYWSLTSILGAQDYTGRLENIQNEWSLNTAAKVQSTDTAVYALITDAQYKLPTTIPDGVYSALTLTVVAP